MFSSREKEESLIVCGDSGYRTRHRTERSLAFFAKHQRKDRFDILCGARALHRTVGSVALCSVFSSLASVVEFERNNNNEVFDPRITHFYL